MGFSRQEYWNGLPFPFSRGSSYPGIEPESPALSGRFLTTEPPGKSRKDSSPHQVRLLVTQAENSEAGQPPRLGKLSLVPPYLLTL